MTDLPERPKADDLADYLDLGAHFRGFGNFSSRPLAELARNYIAKLPLQDQAGALLDQTHYLVRQRVRALGGESSGSSGPYVRADILQGMVDEGLIAPTVTVLNDAEAGHSTTHSHVQSRITERPAKWTKYAAAAHAKNSTTQER